MADETTERRVLDIITRIVQYNTLSGAAIEKGAVPDGFTVEESDNGMVIFKADPEVPDFAAFAALGLIRGVVELMRLEHDQALLKGILGGLNTTLQTAIGQMVHAFVEKRRAERADRVMYG